MGIEFEEIDVATNLEQSEHLMLKSKWLITIATIAFI